MVGEMLADIFNKYCLCNFNECTQEADLPNDELIRVWRCAWSTETLARILDSWLQRRESPIATDADGWRLLCDVIELTVIFVQANFTGPFEQRLDFGVLLAGKASVLQDYEPFDKLMRNGEEINPNVQLGELLVMAKEILRQLLGKWPESLYLHWWELRLVCIHQQVIDELTSDLYEQLKSAADFLLQHADGLEDDELAALLHLEVANGYLLFHRSQKSDETLDRLCKRLRVALNVEGLLGVRTKFQQKALPQLCLKVAQQSGSSLPRAAATNGATDIPKLLLLEDDTRLERIRFIAAEDNEVMSLPSVLQALVLAKVKQLKRSQPKDRLADEELEPYIQTLLYQEHGPLQVRQAALLLNCVQEATQRRAVERSWKQCEEVVKLLGESRYSPQERLSYGFASFLQPRWQVQMQLCELLLSLGMTKSALDIYLQVQAWPEVISCYTRLELRHKAAEVIRQELEKKPTVLLYCLLGDATDDPTCYETAWQHSKETSGKAQAHWGTYYFQRKEYEPAIEHLEHSVTINSLQEKIWLRLGYAAIMLERWQLAVHAYITYTHLEPLGFESWNNLAKALIKLGDKRRAHKVLAESLKCNYNNWKVWENFMVVAVDTGHFEDTLNAYQRLTELKERYLDLEVLTIAISAIAQGTPDAKGQTPERLLKKATALMGHECVRHGNEPKVWELAAQIAATPLAKSQKLMKALRAHTAKEPAWTSKQPCTLHALTLCRSMCEEALAALQTHADDESAAMLTSQLNSARLAAQGCVRALEKEAASEPCAEQQQLLDELRQLLERTTAEVRQRSGAS